MDKAPVFTIITICYRRLAFLQEALGAMLRQTYPHLEIIIVNNGAIPEVYAYITALEKKDSRVKIVHFQENQYRNDDHGYMNKVCLNAGLKEATGDFIFYQSDDDLLADDYVAKMISIFEGNPDCTSAAGYVKDMDAAGHLLPEGPRMTNYRPRYMPGHLLALSTLDKVLPRMVYSAPGCNFAFRKEEFVHRGGYHPCVEDSQLYGIVPFGITGFDETAILYWRRHEGQLNRYQNAVGYTGIDASLALLKDWKIQERWEIFGKDMAQYVVQRIQENNYHAATNWFVISLYCLRFKSACRLWGMLWNRKYFWSHVLKIFWQEKRIVYYNLKPQLKRIFEMHHWLVRVPGISFLVKKVYQ